MSDPLVGTRLDGQFDLLELIGQGGMGRVYEATQQPLGRTVAVKIMADRPADESNATARFRREAQALSRLSHPNIVTIHDFGRTDDGWIYLVMERVVGQDLQDVLDVLVDGPGEREQLDLVRISRICEQVAAALAEAHSHGIIHRDLKPSNVFLTGVAGRDEQVKLLDFGLARAFIDDPELAQVTADDVVVGTSGYLAPEQLRREALGPATDVWALAVLLYRMLTGLLPFRGSKAEILDRTLEKHPAAPSTFREDLPRAADRVVLWGLNKKPEDRPPSVVDLARAFAFAVGAPFSLDQAHISTVPAQPVVRIPTTDHDATVAAVRSSMAHIPSAPSVPAQDEPTVQADPPPHPSSRSEPPSASRPLPSRSSRNLFLVLVVAALSALLSGVAAYLAVRG